MKVQSLVMLNLAAAIATAGCSTKHLVFTTYTKMGLDIAVTDSQPTHAMFGYKRYEGAIVPVDLCVDSDSAKTGRVSGACGKNKAEAEAMSVYAGMEVHNNWLGGLEILQLFATGPAAVHAAKDPEAFAGIVKSVRKAEEEE